MVKEIELELSRLPLLPSFFLICASFYKQVEVKQFAFDILDVSLGSAITSTKEKWDIGCVSVEKFPRDVSIKSVVLSNKTTSLEFLDIKDEGFFEHRTPRAFLFSILEALRNGSIDLGYFPFVLGETGRALTLPNTLIPIIPV